MNKSVCAFPVREARTRLTPGIDSFGTSKQTRLSKVYFVWVCAPAHLALRSAAL